MAYVSMGPLVRSCRSKADCGLHDLYYGFSKKL